MKGKIGLIVGLGVGYVLGTRAGRERYEQIKEAAGRVWEMEPVQAQVTRVKGLAKRAALAVPRAVWLTAVKVTQAVSGEATPEKTAIEAPAPAPKKTTAATSASKTQAAKKKTTKKPATKTTTKKS